SASQADRPRARSRRRGRSFRSSARMGSSRRSWSFYIRQKSSNRITCARATRIRGTVRSDVPSIRVAVRILARRGPAYLPHRPAAWFRGGAGSRPDGRKSHSRSSRHALMAVELVHSDSWLDRVSESFERALLRQDLSPKTARSYGIGIKNFFG